MVAAKPPPLKGLTLPARVALASVVDPARYQANRRRAMGETDPEVRYLARLRAAMGHAKRYGDAMWPDEGRRLTYRQLRNRFRKYMAAKAAAKGGAS